MDKISNLCPKTKRLAINTMYNVHCRYSLAACHLSGRPQLVRSAGRYLCTASAYPPCHGQSLKVQCSIPYSRISVPHLSRHSSGDRQCLLTQCCAVQRGYAFKFSPFVIFLVLSHLFQIQLLISKYHKYSLTPLGPSHFFLMKSLRKKRKKTIFY